MSFLDKPWRYINEGNVHIVIQILGTDYVLRIIKEDDKSLDIKNVNDSVDFVNLVMMPLLSNTTNDLQEIVELPASDLLVLDEKLTKIRPKHRIFKSILSSYAIKAHNLTILSTECTENYCLELKPKDGFVSLNLKKYAKCYYCLKQYLKLQERQIEKISKYCPLDLFSGHKERMKLALLNLISNPQNNLKLFKDGNIIFGNESNSKDFDIIVHNMEIFEYSTDPINLFLDFIIEVLLSKHGKSSVILKESKKPSLLIEKLNCTENSELERDTFLYKMLCLQKLTENFNCDMYSDGNLDYVPTIIKQLKLNNLNLSLEKDREIFISKTEAKNLSLISAVARDCSIMISFTPHFEEGFPTVQIGKRKVSYKINVTDLDPKPAKTLVKRLKTEKKLLDIYERIVATKSERQCKIQPHTETRAKQLEAWQQLISDYMKTTKQSTIDIRESQNGPLFNNDAINRKLSQESILTILEDMAKNSKAAPIDKSKTVWEVYWHSLDEWGNMVYTWACNNGLNNSVCTLFELREGENTAEEEFHGLDMNILLKALKALEAKGKCELMAFDDNQGVKFF